MSERRILKNQVDTDFKEVLIATDTYFKLTNNKIVHDYYGKVLNDNCKWVLAKGKKEIGLTQDNTLLYDSMLTNIVDRALATYFENKIKAKGYICNKKFVNNKIILEIIK